MLNENGRSYPFDDRGNGYGRGEGVTAVVLKRLPDALKSEDNIRAVIRGTAVNQDGKTNGITLPNQLAQEDLMKSLYRRTGIDPRNTRYIEAHGTGTVVGDLAELQAIANFFSKPRQSQDTLSVGSIKSNIGHLESSSGLAGLIKTVLAVEKGYIPPNADYQTSKPSLKFKEWNIHVRATPSSCARTDLDSQVPTKLEAWPSSGLRQASVNSFGYGGVNAHAIIQSAPWQTTNSNEKLANGCLDIAAQGAVAPTRRDYETNGITSPVGFGDIAEASSSVIKTSPQHFCPLLFIISANSQISLSNKTTRLKDWASKKMLSPHDLENLAYTLSNRRSRLQWRCGFVAGSQSDFMKHLSDEAVRGTKISKHREVAFVFTGQGAQWFAMGRELSSRFPSYRKSLISSQKTLKGLGAFWALTEVLDMDEKHSPINESEIAQPASTALQIALVDLLSSFNIRPQTVIGHSSGEIGAAYAAGIISRETALKVSFCRGQISKMCEHSLSNKGAMLSVALGEAAVTPLLQEARRGVVSIACVNSPSSTTVSGDEPAIDDLKEKLDQLNVFNRKLKVDIAYHSHHMQKVADQYHTSLGMIETSSPRSSVTFISSVTATRKTKEFDSVYWVENLISKVRFCDALEEYCHTKLRTPCSMVKQALHVIIEIGPHSVLRGPIRQTITNRFNSFDYMYLPTLLRGRDGTETILDLVGRMFACGHPVDQVFTSQSSSQCHLRILHDLPTYSWDHSRTYWYESRLSRDYRLREYPCHDLLGSRIPSSVSLEPSWRHCISMDSMPWLAEHVIDGLAIFPGAGYLCMAIESLKQITWTGLPYRKVSRILLQDVAFLKALVVPPSPQKTELQICLRPQLISKKLWHDFRIYAYSQEGSWHEHCRGRITTEVESVSDGNNHAPVLNSVQLDTREKILKPFSAQCKQMFEMTDIYKEIESNGNSYGACFAAIQEMKIGDALALSRIMIPNVQAAMPGNYQQPHIIHPCTLDALMHTALPLYTRLLSPRSVMPVSVDELSISPLLKNSPGEELVTATKVVPNGARSALAEVSVFHAAEENDSHSMVTISGVEIHGVGTSRSDTLDRTETRDKSFHVEWNADVDYLWLKAGRPHENISFQEFFRCLRFKRSRMRILQIGVDPTQARFYLQEIYDNQSVAILSYDITHDKVESLKEVQEALPSWETFVNFRVLDIQRDPVGQGFVNNSYDLVIASGLPLSSSDCLVGVIGNICDLLNHDGRLLLSTRDNLLECQGTLDELLMPTSFQGLDFFLHNKDAATQSYTGAVSRPARTSSSSVPQVVVIVPTSGLEDFASTLVLALKDRGFTPCISTWNTISSNEQAVYIILDSSEKPILTNSKPACFEQTTRLIQSTLNVF